MRNQNGFTLIELMIVIAILAIIAAIAIGGITAASGGSNETNMGTSGGTVADTQVNTLVCKRPNELPTNEPSVPGERWRFEGGVFVTNDANGNPVTRAAGDCNVE